MRSRTERVDLSAEQRRYPAVSQNDLGVSSDDQGRLMPSIRGIGPPRDVAGRDFKVNFGRLIDGLRGTSSLTVRLVFDNGPTLRFRLEPGEMESLWASAVATAGGFAIALDDGMEECVQIEPRPWLDSWTDTVRAFTKTQKEFVR